MNYNFVYTDFNQRKQAIELLTAHKLPVSDIDENKDLWVLVDDTGEVMGTGGLEFFEDVALLRSVSVKTEFNGKGMGKKIVTSLERVAVEKGVTNIFLLTTTAADFFKAIGYNEVSREEVPSSIKKSSEFSSICPSTAIVIC